MEMSLLNYDSHVFLKTFLLRFKQASFSRLLSIVQIVWLRIRVVIFTVCTYSCRNFCFLCLDGDDELDGAAEKPKEEEDEIVVDENHPRVRKWNLFAKNKKFSA